VIGRANCINNIKTQLNRSTKMSNGWQTQSWTAPDRHLRPQTWLLALTYVCFVLNFTVSALLNWRTPMEVLTGSIPDICPLLSFEWWEPTVYSKLDNAGFPSKSREKQGCFVGISKHVGHAMTYMILTDDTQKIIHRSNVQNCS
jgi:hypothetical protein